MMLSEQERYGYMQAAVSSNFLHGKGLGNNIDSPQHTASDLQNADSQEEKKRKILSFPVQNYVLSTLKRTKQRGGLQNVRITQCSCSVL